MIFMKMNNPELEVVRFGAEDILTTSGGGSATPWSAKSYYAGAPESMHDENNNPIYANYYNYDPVDGNYNVLDGNGSTDDFGEIFTVGNYYHYDTSSAVDEVVYWNWKTCTDESHHSN